MKVTQISILLFLSFFLLSSSQLEEQETGYSIAKRMFEKAPQIQSLIYTITKEERIDGEMIKQISFTKMIKEPFKVYLRQSYPKEGMEILYVEGENSNKAIINPNGFPWVNIKLNPHEGIMRNDQHHTLFQSGFDHVISILEYSCNKYPDKIESMVIFNGIINFNNRKCYSISFTNPDFTYLDYTVNGDETVEDIANKYKLSEYMILEKNPSIKDYDDVSAGQVIKIPSDYSPKMNLYIDKADLIPVNMEVYDEQGLFEKYEYSKVSINPKIPYEQFSKDYSKYGF